MQSKEEVAAYQKEYRENNKWRRPAYMKKFHETLKVDMPNRR